MYELVDIRRTLTGSWSPPLPRFSGNKRERLEQLWAELLGVDAGGYWQSESYLATNLVEALLRERLLEVMGPERIRGRTLGQLIAIASGAGVLPAGGGVTGAHTLSSVRLLRNWVAHTELYYEHPTEQRAVQTLVLMICIAEALFPELAPWVNVSGLPEVLDRSWLDENWSRCPTPYMMPALQRWPATESLPDFVSDGAFHDRIFTMSAPSTISSFLEVARKRNLDQDPLREALNRNYATIVQRAAQSPATGIGRLSEEINRLDLPLHALAYAILLPFDGDVLAGLLDAEHPTAVAHYIAKCHAASPNLFIARAGNPRAMQSVVDVWWTRWFECGDERLGYMVELLKRMPQSFGRAVLGSAPTGDLLDWIRNTNAFQALNLLRLFPDKARTQDASVDAQARQVSEALSHAVSQLGDSQLSRIPHWLSNVRIANQKCGESVLRPLLSRATSMPCDDARRLLWDIALYCPALSADAASVAENLVLENLATPTWGLLCLAGMVEILEPGALDVAWPDVVLDEQQFAQWVADGKRDRWQRFLALVAYERAATSRGFSMPVVAQRVLAPLAAATVLRQESDMSAALLAEARRLLSVEGDGELRQDA